jgi:Fur family transcriptional regulator, ferric uptake regulator
MDIHQEVVTRLAALDQRYTRGRRALVDVLAAADRPLTVPEMIGPSVPQSSAYRNLAVLIEAGVVHRIAGADEFARFELAEDVAEHHHHLLCSNCGAVADVTATPRLEKALSEAAVVAAEENGFEVTGHRIDLVGRCASCR